MTVYTGRGSEEPITQASAVLISLETAVMAFVESITHVFGVETGSVSHRVGQVHVIHHPNDILHHYPREFSFRREFVSLGGATEDVLESVRLTLSSPTEDHVLYVFGDDVGANIPQYEAMGYQHAWNNGLMAVQIDATRSPLAPDYFLIRELTEIADVAMYEGLGGPTAVGHTLFDPHIHSFVSYDQSGKPLGRSQLVTKVDRFAYVSGMFTAPDHRNRGVGSGLMNTMHKRARREGAEYCILVPSRMASEINFYPRFGYEVVAPHSVFVPVGPDLPV